MFKRIDHVELVTDQPEQTVKFYTEVLGFSVKKRDRVQAPNGTALDLAYLDLGGTVIEVITYNGVKPGPAASGVHLGWNLAAIEVEDMAKAVDFLKSKGVPITWGPLVRDTYARAEIHDPNGYSIELRQWK
ncbi:MAG TPA: VOC family protein [Stellaceae bacterium]|nr:VOC family protein [Stellaceae bacterium]